MPILNVEYIFFSIYSAIYSGSQRIFDWVARLITLETIRWIVIGWILLGLLFMISSAILLIKIYNLRKQEKQELNQAVINLSNTNSRRNARWEKIVKYLDSDNPSDWKLAIIEADVILDELVTKMGYAGDNLGEKLKAVEPSDFLTLQAAWDAHKVRNMIAHEANFFLTKREARRTLDLFQKVFEEFHFI